MLQINNHHLNDVDMKQQSDRQPLGSEVSKPDRGSQSHLYLELPLEQIVKLCPEQCSKNICNKTSLLSFIKHLVQLSLKLKQTRDKLNCIVHDLMTKQNKQYALGLCMDKQCKHNLQKLQQQFSQLIFISEKGLQKAEEIKQNLSLYLGFQKKLACSEKLKSQKVQIKLKKSACLILNLKLRQKQNHTLQLLSYQENLFSQYFQIKTPICSFLKQKLKHHICIDKLSNLASYAFSVTKAQSNINYIGLKSTQNLFYEKQVFKEPLKMNPQGDQQNSPHKPKEENLQENQNQQDQQSKDVLCYLKKSDDQHEKCLMLQPNTQQIKDNLYQYLDQYDQQINEYRNNNVEQ